MAHRSNEKVGVRRGCCGWSGVEEGKTGRPVWAHSFVLSHSTIHDVTLGSLDFPTTALVLIDLELRRDRLRLVLWKHRFGSDTDGMEREVGF